MRKAGRARLVSTDERDTWAGCELNVRYAPRRPAPAHIAGDHMSVREDFFNDSDMSSARGTLHSRPQNNNRSQRRLARNAPIELMCAVRPLPGGRLRAPGHIEPVQLVIALVSPPGATTVRKNIATSLAGSGMTTSLARSWMAVPRPRSWMTVPRPRSGMAVSLAGNWMALIHRLNKGTEFFA